MAKTEFRYCCGQRCEGWVSELRRNTVPPFSGRREFLVTDLIFRDEETECPFETFVVNYQTARFHDN